ncbi:unnamed protein product [Ambrosiozyma monospora]|uniref:Unnamed protein product n=1 Tax=Ambrosiozyma monospora TaxID=43982 RepID=A0ACB5TQ45_AMBMO|nr:unnamed protein product [Ambrosiozyma monospora]
MYEGPSTRAQGSIAGAGRKSPFQWRRSNTSSLDLKNINSIPSNSIAKIADAPIRCLQNTSVVEVAKQMNETRNHCVIVVDSEDSNKLVGLVTAKDLAYRIVASSDPSFPHSDADSGVPNIDQDQGDHRVTDIFSQNSADVPVWQIMTHNPYFYSVTTSATDALRLMVTKKIRHLPLIDDEVGTVVGILNITKCFYHAMIRLEKMSLESQKLQMTFNDLKGTNASSLVGGVTTGANTAAEFRNFSLVNNSSEVGQGTRIKNC